MYTSSDRLIGILENKCVFLAEDIPVLNQLLAETRIEDIPSRFKGEIIDIIDMMLVCGNISLETRTRIDSLYDHLSNE